MQGRDFFQIDAPALAVQRAGLSTTRITTSNVLVLDLQVRQSALRDVRVDGLLTSVVSFPNATQAIAALAMDTDDYASSADDVIHLFLTRAPFDRLADQHGAARITHLCLELGLASDDSVMTHLAASLTLALEPHAATNRIVVEQIALALNSHLAQRYGGMRPQNAAANGGLSPWQLRLARNALERDLGGTVCLEGLARECGLSVSHFSRSFRRSTGLAPHRWLMRRRVEIAKDLVLEGEMPLAEIALACCFSDQSHFTRVFASLTGATPGRWRAAQDRDNPLSAALATVD